MSDRRTYWHLEDFKRKPKDYDIATTKLLYHQGRPFEVTAPLAAWYAKHQSAGGLSLPDWEAFRDPRETTYARYTELQLKKEGYVEGLLESIEKSHSDAQLTPECRALLARTVGPLRYPLHGLQMAAAYVGSMAPSGRLVVACLFQAGDELRRVQRLAYRLAQLQQVDGELGRDAKQRWQTHPGWQPLRQLIEKLLCTYDWAHALVALNLAVKPLLDQLFMVELGVAVAAQGDDVTPKVLASLDEDCAWHRAWTAELVQLLAEADVRNALVIEEWMRQWQPLVRAAVEACAAELGSAEAAAKVERFAVRWWSTLGLGGRSA